MLVAIADGWFVLSVAVRLRALAVDLVGEERAGDG